MKAAFVGLGLIGGSLALTLRRRGFIDYAIGVDLNPGHAKSALDLGLADEVTTLQEAAEKSDVVILSIPVDAAKNIISELLEVIPEHGVVADMGSTKAGICQVVSHHPKRGRFVASHPIAGTENTGPQAAFDSLFQGKPAIICEREKSDKDALQLVEDLYAALDMPLIYMEAMEHDLHLAYVSHLSHITSFCLGFTVLEVEKDEKNIFDLAGSGFASTARLAKSSPEMWAPIFEQNKDHLLRVMDEYMKNLSAFKTMIESDDHSGLSGFMEKANDIRRILDGMELKHQKNSIELAK